MRIPRLLVILGALCLALPACVTGPTYVRPETPAPPAFKEADGWKAAEPNDQAPRGKWWETFGDAQLNALEEQLTVANNTLRAAQASFEQARALVRSAQSYQLPTAVGVAGLTTANTSETRPNASRTPNYTDYLLRADVAWEADVWGRVRQTVSASRASAQAAAADVEIVSLSLHAELAANYFGLRALESERRILETSVAGYERALELTTNRYHGGLASAVDVAQAQHAARGDARAGHRPPRSPRAGGARDRRAHRPAAGRGGRDRGAARRRASADPGRPALVAPRTSS